MEFLGLPEAANDCLDSTEGGRGKRRRRASTRDLGDVLVGEQRVVDKRLPDLVEAVIGEAFEASLKLPLRERGKLCRGGARPRRSVSQRRQPFAGANRWAEGGGKGGRRMVKCWGRWKGSELENALEEGWGTKPLNGRNSGDGELELLYVLSCLLPFAVTVVLFPC